MPETEILIVGAGIAGASTAYHLAERGHRVTLLERGAVASGASGVNAGSIDSLGWGHQPDLQATLTAGSVEVFQSLALDQGYDLEFRQSGSLRAILTEPQLDFARQRVQSLQAAGFRIELLTIRQARALEPALSSKLLGCLYSPERAQADPLKATRAFATAAERAGASVLTGQEVTAIAARADASYEVTTPLASFRAGTLVLAAGAWCAPLGALLGLDIPIVPVRGQMWATSSQPPRLFQTLSSIESILDWASQPDRASGAPPELTHEGPRRLTRHLYGRQTRSGEIIFGGDRQQLGYTSQPDPAGIEVNRGQAIEVVPLLSELPVARTWAGLMPFALDGRPLIGRLPGYANLFVVSGLASSGFGRGPMAGRLLAELIHGGAPPAVLAEADPAQRVGWARSGAP